MKLLNSHTVVFRQYQKNIAFSLLHLFKVYHFAFHFSFETEGSLSTEFPKYYFQIKIKKLSTSSFMLMIKMCVLPAYSNCARAHLIWK